MTAPATISAAMSVKDAATYLGVSCRTLYRITAECGAGRAELPVVQIRGRRMFLRRDLDAYLDAHTVAGTRTA